MILSVQNLSFCYPNGKKCCGISVFLSEKENVSEFSERTESESQRF